MERSSQINKLAKHPFQAYLAQQMTGPPHERKISDQTNSSLRILAPQELESLVADHQQWLESSDYQKWSQTKTEERNRYVKGRIDLSRCNLRGVKLDHVNLRDAICWQSDFQGASLKHVNFEHADLWGANFSRSNLYRAQLSHADAWDVNFSEANINGAQLNKVVMGGGNFHKAKMLDTQCEQAFLGECNFQEADLRRSNFYRADMREVQFQGANLLEANFCDTNLQRANFHKCSGLQEGRLSGALLSDSTYPEGYGAFRQGLRFQEVICQSLTKGLILLLFLTGYLLLTLWSTSDAQFLTNSLIPGLPIIRVGVPVTNFVLIFSAILLGVFTIGIYMLRMLGKESSSFLQYFPMVVLLTKNYTPGL